jgi:large subunit ribosomal protein L29
MKGLKSTELKGMDAKQIEKQINENKARLTALEFQKVIAQLDNHAQINTLRKDIARLKTALRQREIEAEAQK